MLRRVTSRSVRTRNGNATSSVAGSVLRSFALQRSGCSVPCTLATATAGAPSSSAMPPLPGQAAAIVGRRFQEVQHGRRDHEAFLSQHDPVEVLGLSEDDVTYDKAKEAYERLLIHYGPKGPQTSAKMHKRVVQAWEIINDPVSPYYTKARIGDDGRRRLQLAVMPAKHRWLLNAQAGMYVVAAVVFFWFIFYLCMQPVQKGIRSATRAMQ